MIDFDASALPLRTNNRHRQEMLDSLVDTEAWQINGVKYSYLMRLPNICFPWSIVVDPMHHLLEGVTKYMLGVWTNPKLYTLIDEHDSLLLGKRALEAVGEDIARS